MFHCTFHTAGLKSEISAVNIRHVYNLNGMRPTVCGETMGMQWSYIAGNDFQCFITLSDMRDIISFQLV